MSLGKSLRNGPSRRDVLMVVMVLLMAVITMSHASGDFPPITQLDNYVRENDGVFAWKNLNYNFSFDGAYTAHLFHLTSTRYLTPNLTSRSIWNHTMVYVVPTNLNRSCETAFMWLTWGSNGHPWHGQNNTENDLDLAIITQVAIHTGCPAVAVYDIPNQEICFYDEPGNPQCGSEDGAIAYTFNRFLYKGRSAEWMLLFPMVKAGIRAMDAIEEISAAVFGQPMYRFVVSGASKRGWTTWLVGATDWKSRVVAIVPFVLDALNFGNFVHRQWQSYNGFTFVLQPYVDFGLTAATAMPIFQQWTNEVDPYSYRPRLMMPKLSINAVGDEFQLLDDQAHWANDMFGEMKTMLIKDADHLLITNMDLVLKTVVSFCQSVVFGSTRPSYTWSIDAHTGQITVETSVPPTSVVLIQTNISTTSRDFRDTVLHESPCVLHVMGGCVRFLLWESTSVSPSNQAATSFTTHVPVPSSGWTGFYLQLTFDSGSPNVEPLYFATPASVLPLGFPYTDCSGVACNTTLV